MEEIKFANEEKILTENFQGNIEELKIMSSFYSNFINNIKNLTHFDNTKFKFKRGNNKNIFNSVLFDNIESMYDSFQTFINNIKNISNKIQNHLIKPINLFMDDQSKVYQNTSKNIKQLIKEYDDHKMMHEYAKNNYYLSSFINKKNNNNSIINQITFKNKDFDNSFANSIKNKMISKNYEHIYKYEINGFNSFILNNNNSYNEIKKNIENNEKNRIFFIKVNLDKFKVFLEEIYNEFLKFTKLFEKNFSNEVCDEELKIWNNKLFEDKNKEGIVPLQTFVPFQDFYAKNKEMLLNNKYNFDIKIDNIDYCKNLYYMKEDDMSKNFNNIINSLLKKENINIEQINLLFDLFQNNKKKESYKLFVDCLLNKNNEVSILKFSNLKNLEYLSDCLNYIILREDSILEGNFEINIKIIYISEKTFFQNEENNDKIYLSALLSKNKYLRTSQFWRDILEFKLANKINDSIQRFNVVFTFKKEKKKGFFSKIGGAIRLTNAMDDSIFSKNRIYPLIKNFNELDERQVEIIDKISIQELLNLIKNNIPNMMNFNYPPELCLDLIAKLIDEYKIPKKHIKYFVIYTNVCSKSIRRLLKTEENSEKNKISNFKKRDGKIELYKILSRTIPYLDYKDFNKLLLCSKTTNQRLKNKIYSHVLKQKNVNNNIRLIIWENKLKVKELKKKYNYRDILNKGNNEKVKRLIKLDVSRTSVKDKENENEIKNKLIDVLLAISQFSEDINYFQGMQYIVLFLMELYGEEESFYLFLSLLLNTEYSLLFAKDLQKLKIFFYVFKRIISLFEPELSSFLNINNLQVDLFLAPWFITLFSGTHHFLRKKEDNTPIVIRIIDFFILYGWKSSMSIGCALLHTYEKDIMKLDFEGLNRFLLNDILKQNFFLNENLYLLEKCMDEFKISKKLISNIEAEYNIEKKENINK